MTPENTERLSYISASRHHPYYANYHSGSFPENAGSQVPRGSLHPPDKKREAEDFLLDKTNDPAGLAEFSNSNLGCHFSVPTFQALF